MKNVLVIPLFGFILSILVLVFMECHEPEPPSIDLAPVKNLILFDRSVVKQYDQNVERILKQRKDISIPELNINACRFIWGGEVGGPFTRILCFSRPLPDNFQCTFLYEGEYEMTRMRGISKQIKSGKNHSLGVQLTQVGNSLGDDIRLDKEKMKTLLVVVMEDLMHYRRIRKSYMDSLDMNNLPSARSEHFNFKFSENKKFLQTIQMVKNEMTIQPDPNVFFFEGELINGIWKGTVRQYDHTGRYCIELDYLNGDFAYTHWL